MIALCSPVGIEPNVRPSSRGRRRGDGGGMRRVCPVGTTGAVPIYRRAMPEVRRMPVVWSDRHRGHRPDGGYWLGVREHGDEEPERGDVLRAGLQSAGYEIVTPPDLGREPITAVHDADFVEFLARCYASWVAEGHLVDPGQPHVVPYLFATGPFARRHLAGRRPATIRAELGLYAMDTMTLLSEGTFDAACSAVHAAAHAADLVAGGAGSRLCRRAATRSPRRPGVLRRCLLPQQRCRRRPTAARRRLSAGCRLSTSTPIRATARRRSSGSGPTSSTPACTSTPAPAGSPTSSATPTSAAGEMAQAGTSTCRCPPAPATRPGSPGYNSCSPPSIATDPRLWSSHSVWMPRQPIRLLRWRSPPPGSTPPARCSPRWVCRRCSCKKAGTCSTSSPPWWSRYSVGFEEAAGG